MVWLHILKNDVDRNDAALRFSGEQRVERELDNNQRDCPQSVITPPALIRRIAQDLFPRHQEHRARNAHK